MELIIEEVDKSTISDVGKIDGRFVIDGRLLLQAENDQIHYSVIDLPPIEKRYGREDIDYSAT